MPVGGVGPNLGPNNQGDIDHTDFKNPKASFAGHTVSYVNFGSDLKFKKSVLEKIFDFFSKIGSFFHPKTDFHARHQEVRNEVKEAIHVEVFNTLKNVTFPKGIDLKGDAEFLEDKALKAPLLALAKDVEKLQTLLNSEIETKDVKHALHRALRTLYHIFDNKAYQALKEDESYPVIAYLHDLAEDFYFNTGGGDEYGKYLGAIEKEANTANFKLPQVSATFQQGAERIEKLYEYSNESYHTKDIAAKKVNYFFTHMSRTIASAQGNIARGTFDPLMKGNHVMVSGSYILSDQEGKKHETVHVYTPSIVLNGKLNPIACAMMQRLKNRQEYQKGNGTGEWLGNPIEGGMTHLEISTLQTVTSHNKGEQARSQITLDLEDQFKGVVSVQGWDFDHPNFNGKFTKDNAGEDFKQYFTEVLLKDSKGICSFQDKSQMKNTGIYFPDLTKEEMIHAIETAAIFFEDANREILENLSLREKGQMFAQVMASFADMLSQRKKSLEHDVMGKMQMCKQNVDRGAVANAIAKILHTTLMIDDPKNDAYEVKKLRQKVIEEAVFGRAPAVDDRGVMKKRLNILVNFMKLAQDIGEASLGKNIRKNLLEERGSITEDYISFAQTDEL